MKFFPEKGIEGGDPQVAENIRTGSDYPKDAVIVGRKEIGKARANVRPHTTLMLYRLLIMSYPYQWKEARVFAVSLPLQILHTLVTNLDYYRWTKSFTTNSPSTQTSAQNWSQPSHQN